MDIMDIVDSTGVEAGFESPLCVDSDLILSIILLFYLIALSPQ